MNHHLNLRKYSKALQTVFQELKAVENVTAIVLTHTQEKKNSNCQRLAQKIQNLQISSLITKVQEQAQKAFKYLYISRRGFYCALCDQTNHKFIDIYSSSIISSNQYCKGLVENTLPFYQFRYNFFHQIARLHALFIVTCDLKGRYDKSKFVPFQSKFFKHPELTKGITKCSTGMGEPHGFMACQDYCSNFNPARFSKMFEGGIDRLLGFAKFLKERVKVKLEHYNRESAKDVLNMKGRLLEALINRKIEMDHDRILSAEKKPEAKKDDKPAGKKDAEKPPKAVKDPAEAKQKEQQKKGEEKNVPGKNEELFKRYKVITLNPLVYSFPDDMKLKHHTSLRKSIFNRGFYKTYRVHKYSNYYDAEGVNWYGLGKGAKFDKEGILQVLEILPPDDTQARETVYYVASHP